MLNWEQFEAWPAVQLVCNRLNEHGYKAYLAGGCVRDVLLGRRPKDFDVATDALPEQIEAIFEKTVAVGKAFGVIVVVVGSESIEVATFRTDGPYLDGRRPSSVIFSSPGEDALRRDFTINALFYDFSSDSVLDFVGGKKDLKRHQIRTVGDPYERFDEDKLRPMRALRFSAELGFAIESHTFDAICDFSDKISVVAKERLLQEFDKLMLASGRRQGLELLVKTGIWQQLLPDFDLPLRFEEEWQQSLRLVESLPDGCDRSLLYSALFYRDWFEAFKKGHSNQAIQLYSGWLKNLKASNELIKGLQYILSAHEMFLSRPGPRLAEKYRKLDHPLADQALQLWRVNLRLQQENEHEVDEFEQGFRTILVEGHLPSPFVSGKDLKELGVAAGPQLGQLLKSVYDEQLEGHLTSREEALEYLKDQV